MLQGVLPDICNACEVHNEDVLRKRKREVTEETRSEVVISSNGAGNDNSRSFKAWVSVFRDQIYVPTLVERRLRKSAVLFS